MGGTLLSLRVKNTLPGSSSIWCEMKLVSASSVEAQRFLCQVESWNIIRCVTPKSKPGLYELRLSRNGQQYGRSSLDVKSYSIVSIQRIHPTSVPSTGGMVK